MKALTQTVVVAFLLLGLSSIPLAETQNIQSLCQFHYPTDYLFEWKCVKLTSKHTPQRVFGKYWQEGLRFNRMDRRHFAAGLSIKVPIRIGELSGWDPMPPTFPEAGGEPRFILIDQNEMYLGAYEYGTLVLSAPVAVGAEGYRLENGTYQVDAIDPWHESNLYPVEGTDRPYPMHYGLRFHIDKKLDGWTSYWIHGRDLPGYPASHGCIGLYDEEMQMEYYDEPAKPVLMDARKLYQWVVGDNLDTGDFQRVKYGPKVLIMGAPPQGFAEPAGGLRPAAYPAPATEMPAKLP